MTIIQLAQKLPGYNLPMTTKYIILGTWILIMCYLLYKKYKPEKEEKDELQKLQTPSRKQNSKPETEDDLLITQNKD